MLVRVFEEGIAVGVNGSACLVVTLLTGKALQLIFVAQLWMRRSPRQQHLAMTELAGENVMRTESAGFLLYQVHATPRILLRER